MENRKREPFAFEVDYGKKGEFRRILGEQWEGIRAFLERNEIHNFSLHECAGLVFGYAEREEDADLSGKERAILADFCEAFSPVGRFIAEPGEGMRLMYHNFGRIRSSKELIRLRVFMTRLKPGCAEEYKRRHDGLIAKRGDTVDPGPDSNFSIWSAGGYIFGYDEIDTSMEREETPEEAAASLAWETAQLGIMDWITNDVDAMSGEHHPQVVRLAWHV